MEAESPGHDHRQAARRRQSAGRSGDRIPIRSQIWRKLDGTDTWQFDIVGIYDVEAVA